MLKYGWWLGGGHGSHRDPHRHPEEHRLVHLRTVDVGHKAAHSGRE
jgi:hypothetical protein